VASIRINDLNVVGANLLSDEESFLNELSDDQSGLTHGGVTPFLALGLAAAWASYQVGRNHRAESKMPW
jgi:hypothetical protein